MNDANWKCAVGSLLDTLKVGPQWIQVGICFEVVPVLEERAWRFPLAHVGRD